MKVERVMNNVYAVERAARIRGKLTISSSPGGGTRLELIVPRNVAFHDPEPTGKLPKWKRFWR